MKWRAFIDLNPFNHTLAVGMLFDVLYATNPPITSGCSQVGSHDITNPKVCAIQVRVVAMILMVHVIDLILINYIGTDHAPNSTRKGCETKGKIMRQKNNIKMGCKCS